MRVRIVGAGIAGALLAWRIKLADHTARVEVAGGPPRDATAASGGIVRGYDPDPEESRLATAALAELLASRLLRSWSAYEEIGSVFTPLAQDAVVERHAGYISPARLREAVLADFVRMGGQRVQGPVNWHEDPYELVIVAAGPWTPALLGTAEYRTKQVQHGIYETASPVTHAFVNERTGLFGRPVPDGRLLLGVPSDRYGVDPEHLHLDDSLVRRTAELAAAAFPDLRLPEPAQVVVAADCYTDPPGLRLRATSVPNLLTFTGGSGGAAKTALAASHEAALDLLELKTPVPA